MTASKRHRPPSAPTDSNADAVPPRAPQPRRTRHRAVPTDTQATPPAAAEVVGIAGEAQTQSGEDTRKRGWFWHWNSIITQFAPLIGLKGVGLLNSYTVWTDRREESPHHGYAFPSQQSEADFYGEDRAELITINKILVALDLIEIRKEMVVKPDAQGRQWRVPHNFYRVKDHGDGYTLTTESVLKVIELADRDRAVFRYLRRIFSSRFAPIDGDNVWNRILPELQANPTWQKLAAKVQQEEARASERTRAGHAARRSGTATASVFVVPAEGDVTSPQRQQNDTEGDSRVAMNQEEATFVATTNNGLPPVMATTVAETNRGLEVDVASTNSGSPADEPSTVAPINEGRATDVARTNTTYHQEMLTTRTTTTNGKRTHQKIAKLRRARAEASPALATAQPTVAAANDSADLRPTAGEFPGAPGAGPRGLHRPSEPADEATALQAYEDANNRPATPAERHVLRSLAEQMAPFASRAGTTSWGWITAGIYEAVESGSAYVAPRRIREILNRWAREGQSHRSAAPVQDNVKGHAADGTPARTTPAPVTRPSGQRGTGKAVATQPRAVERRPANDEAIDAIVARLGQAADIPLPHGKGSRRTWAFVVRLLGRSLAAERLAEVVAGSAITDYEAGLVTITAPAPQAELLGTTYHDLVERKLAQAMGQPVRLAVVSDGAADPSRQAPVREAMDVRQTEPVVDGDEELPPFIVTECGLPSSQVWAAVLDDLDATGVLTRSDIDAWLRPAQIIGREGGRVVLGVTSTLAQRRLSNRCLPALRASFAAVVGVPLDLDVVVAEPWLAGHPDRGLSPDHVVRRAAGG